MLDVDIVKALLCDGYMTETELRWLGAQAKVFETIAEVGSWHGRSTRALADNLLSNGKLYAIDHWAGSEGERETNHVSASQKDGDHAFMEFFCNLLNHIQTGKVVSMRMKSMNAAECLSKTGIKFDMVFIDAGHGYEEVKADILAWLPLVKDGGMICGHDFRLWPGVPRAVNEIFGTIEQPLKTSFWMKRIKQA